jgi:hypothetical protein
MIEIGLGTLSVALFSWLQRDERLRRCAALLFLNWLLNTAFASVVPDAQWRASFFMATDLTTAALVLVHPAGRWQAALATSYALEIVMHVGLLATLLGGGDAKAATYGHWWATYSVALGQIALVTVWGTHDGLRHHLGAWGRILADRLGVAGLARLATAGGVSGGMDRSRLRKRLSGGDRAVRVSAFQRGPLAGDPSAGPAQVGERGGDADRADDIILRADGRGERGTGNSDARGSIGDRSVTDGSDEHASGDPDVIRHWLAQWMKLRAQSSSRFNEHIERMEAAADSLHQTAKAMRDESEARASVEAEMANALTVIAQRVRA